MKKRYWSSIAVVAMATTGWGCSGGTRGIGGNGDGWGVPEAPDAGTEDAGTGIAFEDSGAPTLFEDASTYPTEDASPPLCLDASAPAEDASPPLYLDASAPTGDASPPFYLDASAPTEDASPPFYLDASAPTGDASPPFCPDPAGHDACWASCCTAAGPVAALTSAADVTAALTGSWQFCSAAYRWQSLGPIGAAGVEFTSDGIVYFLVQEPGGLVRGAGFAYQWSYEVQQVDGAFLVSFFPNGDSGFSSALRYSPCPRELQFDSVGLGESSLLVPAQ